MSKAAVDKYSRDLAAEFKDETVLPGALVPALLEDNGPTVRFFTAQDFK